MQEPIPPKINQPKWKNLDDRNIYGMNNKELSKILAVVMQGNSMEFDFTVKEIVSMGRFSHISRFSNIDGNDEELIKQSLEKLV